MAIEIVNDGLASQARPPRCWFCRAATHNQHEPSGVPCCSHCAKEAESDDIPTKELWLRREAIAQGSFTGGI
jgi:ribosomal protein L37AE/L43A